MTRIKVYTASKLAQADRWKRLVDEWPEVHFVARWPGYVGVVPDEPDQAEVFWQHDIEDVTSADAVLVYAEAGEHLRGALVEAGAAIALGKPVIVVGTHADYGTWQYHPLVHRVADLDGARELLQTMMKYRGAYGLGPI